MEHETLPNEMPIETTEKSKIPYRQIRAVYDADTITVYQAYSVAIATAAVKEQKLCASREFSFERYTWIKPSWCWMMFGSSFPFCPLDLDLSNSDLSCIIHTYVYCNNSTIPSSRRAEFSRFQNFHFSFFLTQEMVSWSRERAVRIFNGGLTQANTQVPLRLRPQRRPPNAHPRPQDIA